MTTVIMSKRTKKVKERNTPAQSSITPPVPMKMINKLRLFVHLRSAAFARREGGLRCA